MAVRKKMRWKDEKLSVVRKENQPAPESVLEFITCTCHKSNCTNFYKCRLLSMECTDVFKCRGKNVESDNDEVEEDNENDNADDRA